MNIRGRVRRIWVAFPRSRLAAALWYAISTSLNGVLQTHEETGNWRGERGKFTIVHAATNDRSNLSAPQPAEDEALSSAKLSCVVQRNIFVFVV